jgi:hypothetical protein
MRILHVIKTLEEHSILQQMVSAAWPRRQKLTPSCAKCSAYQLARAQLQYPTAAATPCANVTSAAWHVHDLITLEQPPHPRNVTSATWHVHDLNTLEQRQTLRNVTSATWQVHDLITLEQLPYPAQSGACHRACS